MNMLNIRQVDLTDYTRREMNNLELDGALLRIYEAANDAAECYGFVTLEEVDDATAWIMDKLEVVNCDIRINVEGKTMSLDCVFCLEGNKNDLFGYAEPADGTELIMIRF